MKQVVQAAYSNTSIHKQQWKVVHNVHWCGGEQAEVVVVLEWKQAWTTESVIKFCWFLISRSIQELNFWEIRVGLIITCEMENWETYFFVLRPWFVLSSDHHFNGLTLKAPITNIRKGFFGVTDSKVRFNLLLKSSNSSAYWFGDLQSDTLNSAKFFS